jgi:hypothetical protein
MTPGGDDVLVQYVIMTWPIQ